MAQLSAERIKNAVVSLLSSLDATDQDMAKKLLFRRVEKVSITDGGTAGTAVTTTTFYTNTTGVTQRVVAAYVVAPVSVAADNTDYVTFTLSKADADGSNAATIASGDTRAASLNGLSAGDSEALTVTGSAQDVPDGYHVRIAVAKAASGKAIAAATSQAYVIVVFEPVT